MANSRNKGASFEREIANLLTADLGLEKNIRRHLKVFRGIFRDLISRQSLSCFLPPRIDFCSRFGVKKNEIRPLVRSVFATLFIQNQSCLSLYEVAQRSKSV